MMTHDVGRIGMLLDGKYPQDIRVRKEAESLAAYGFQVCVICPRHAGEKEKEEVKGVSIVRIGNEYSFNDKGWNDIRLAVTWRHPLFKKHLSRLIQEEKLHHLHVHDLPLMQTALDCKDHIKGKVILDMHENYPEGIKSWFVWQDNLLKKIKNTLFFNYSRWLDYEARMTIKADYIIAVVDEMKERLIRLNNIDSKKITVVSNTEKKEIRSIGSKDKLLPSLLPHFLITYVGGFSPERGIDTAIEAMSIIKKEIPEARLVLVGSGHGGVMSYLHAKVKDNGLENEVVFTGKVPFDEAMSYIEYSNINIIPHHINDHTDHTIPHKLFQIMTLGKPILVSSCKPLDRVVSSCNAGRVFQAGSAESFAKEVIWMHAHPEEVEKMASGAKQAIESLHLTWEQDAERLSEFYKTI
jgi:glycosyltransferase involved in cell wall biosynthesis